MTISIKSKIFIENMQLVHKHKVRNRQGQAVYVRPRTYDEKLNCSNLDLKHDTILSKMMAIHSKY